MTPAEASRNRTRIILAFAAVYVIWGSTYLFIKYAIESVPPFMMGAARFTAAGALLYALARWRGAKAPDAHDWRSAAITGVLMLGLGNGAVMWAELTVPTGVVALIVSTVPIWIVLIDWLRPRGVRPRLPVFLGLALGVVGMIILIGPRAIIGQGNVDEIGVLILLVGSLGWAVGTILSKGSKRSSSPIVYSSLQMVAAGIAMVIMSLTIGEHTRFEPSEVTARAFLSWVYLMLAGSIIGYTAYIYLLGKVSAPKAATYAYVNPIIAVLLGWAFLREPIGGRTLIAAAVILAGVAIITLSHGHAVHATGEHPIPTPQPPAQHRQERSAA
jgi:drug/metabolite transporter (DMT)-like permease